MIGHRFSHYLLVSLQLFPRLSATFPDMRVRWAYADARVNGILQHIKSSLGDDLANFQKERKKFGENLFLNSFVSTVFEPPQSPAMMLTAELEAAAQKAGVAAPQVSVTDFSNWDGSVTVKDVLTVAPESLAQLAVVVKAINALKLKHDDGQGPCK
jgi:hypothetical protein